jgi:hypothetical protein
MSARSLAQIPHVYPTASDATRYAAQRSPEQLAGRRSVRLALRAHVRLHRLLVR